MLVLLKLIVTPLLVGAMSAVARAWGPALGGLIMGLPWMTGPVLFFFALERGDVFAARMTIGIELGAATIAAWVLGYTTVARVAGWPASLAAGCASFGIVGTALNYAGDGVALPLATAIGFAGLIGALCLIPIPETPAGPRPLPWWDIPARMLATAAIVAVIIIAAEVVGTTASGIIATFPVIAVVVGSFTHHRWGAASAIRLLRSLLLSLMSFTTFFVVVGSMIERHGAVAAFACALAVALAISASIIAATLSGLIRT